MSHVNFNIILFLEVKNATNLSQKVKEPDELNFKMIP